MNNQQPSLPPPLKGMQQLRWKLTVSYAAVTVGALLTVELVLVGASGLVLLFLLNSGYLQTQIIETAASRYNPALRLFLEQTPPDQNGIDAWLANIQDRIYANTSFFF